MSKVLCTVNPDLVSDAHKKALEAMLRANVANILRDDSRVSVLWCELPADQGFTNYEQPCVSLVVIEAEDGLGQARREAMMGACAESWSEVTGIPSERLMISVFDRSVFSRYMAANQQRMSGLGRIRFALHVARQFAVSKLRRGVLAFHANLGG